MEDPGATAEFLGTHRHAMDAKGRLVLPAPYRELLREGMVMTIGYDNCLTLQTPDQWEQTVTALRGLRSSNPRERMFSRLVASNAQRQELDKQGRISIPQELRDYARLTRDVAVVGDITRVEIWDAGRWDEYEGGGLANLAELSAEFDMNIF